MISFGSAKPAKDVFVMPSRDFREFLDALRKAGQLFGIDRLAALKFEVATALRKSAAVQKS